MEMMRELGFCSGIENYSRILDGRRPGEPPHAARLLPRRLRLLHRRVPQHDGPARGMYEGRPLAQARADRRRVPAAVGPRQPPPAAARVPGAGEPGRLRLGHAGRGSSGASSGHVVEQMSGRPASWTRRSRCGRRTIRSTTSSRRSATAPTSTTRWCTTLTKRMAEDLTDYLVEADVPRALPAALRDRHARAHPRGPVAPPRRLRRARRRQPPARGAGPPGGHAGRDPRRRQGGSCA